LAEQAGFHVLRTDVVRKELAGLPAQGQLASPFRKDLYTSEWKERTYAECLHRAERLLFEGHRVLVDATFCEDKKRRSFLEAAVRWGVRPVMLICQADPETVRKRLDNRSEDASDADWTIYHHLARGWEEPGPLTRQVLQEIPRGASGEQALCRALEVLRALGIQ
jgi:predicted kinase